MLRNWEYDSERIQLLQDIQRDLGHDPKDDSELTKIATKLSQFSSDELNEYSQMGLFDSTSLNNVKGIIKKLEEQKMDDKAMLLRGQRCQVIQMRLGDDL